MSWSYDYYDDGRLHHAYDSTNNWFDRAYAYDHVGRLSEATTYRRAEGLSPSIYYPPDPYQQTTSYDVWNHSSRTGYLYGGGPFGDDGAYVNNRHHEWYYDADGNVTNSLTYHNTIDAAGKQTHVVSGLQRVGNDTTQFPTQPAIDITQGYDGDGRPRQRTQVMRQNIYDDTDENHPLVQVLEDVQVSYYVTSSVLGGAKVMELRPNGEGGAIKKTVWIYAGGQRIAKEEGGSVNFEHHNPATGSWVTTLGHSSYRTATREERDPVGAETPTSNPYPLTPTYAENKWGEPLFIDGGDPFDYSSGQSIDGMPMSASQLAHMMDTGAVVGGLSKGGRDLGALDFTGHGAMGMAYLGGQFGSIRIGTWVSGSDKTDLEQTNEIIGQNAEKEDILRTNSGYTEGHWQYSLVNASFATGTSPQSPTKSPTKSLYQTCREQTFGSGDSFMDKSIPDALMSYLLLAAGGTVNDSAFAASIVAKESNFTWDPTDDHGPAQLTDWWSRNQPALIIPGAYDSFPRPDHGPNAGNRQKKFTGSPVSNILTLGNIVRFQRKHHAGNEYMMAKTYYSGPGDQDAYAKEVLWRYDGYKSFFICLGAK